MKRFNYIYFILLALLAVGIFVFVEDAKIWFLLIMVYMVWLCFGHLFFYKIYKKKLKDKFHNLPQLQGEFTTFWMDTREKKVAVLCVFNPFRVQYIAFDKIEDMSISVDYVKGNNKKAYGIYLVMVISGRKYRLQILRRTSQQFIDMENWGKQMVCQGEAFIGMYENFNVDM